MGKIADFLLTENWEEYKRVQLYKKLGNLLEEKEEEISPKQLKKIKEILREK